MTSDAMEKSMRTIALILALFATHAAAEGSALPGNPCHMETPCPVGERSYHVKEPDGWDGVTPMPLMLHFHGWARTGALPVKHQRISGHTRRRGVLLVAPNGRNKTWQFWRGREDVDFAEAVLRDVMKRYPVDREKIFVSGYSFGSAMAWRFVCESGNGITALFAVAGTLNQSENCRQAPEVVRHVHGTADTVMDFPIGPEGDLLNPVRLWRDKLGCGTATNEGAYKIVDWLSFNRYSWDCAKGSVVLDLHKSGHFIPHGWLGRQLDEMLGREPSYP